MKNNVRNERVAQKLTQDELAKKIGVSRQTINAMETNKYIPSTVLALKVALLLNKKVEELFILEEDD
ncbi:helix-turn-helix transcriptional regulator [Rufibacter tibetensis]|uniref:XRE family transcriptional regulator n=1 Tax=Rufibacter tibetensis TaxID=512763 RepID=A0A0P0C5K9_9BACT|nr:helix-turn-helix domain-containing protein [Rufibacter tibetensis]ALJ00482.1 XRE family transcriptional regulator [Rufibacter tibetensis]